MSRQNDWPKAVRDLAPWIDSAPAPGSEWASKPPPQFPLPYATGYGRDGYGLYCDFAVKGVVQRLRWIPPGSFMMGSPQGEAERNDDELLHEVELTSGFWLGDTAVTQALWQTVTGENPSSFDTDNNNPVEQVSWEDVRFFCDQLNEVVPNASFGLPTEAQWEYACRAGSATAYWWGGELSPEQAQYDWSLPYKDGQEKDWERTTVVVKSFAPNPWGLYQMHGNVWEWCADWYGDYSEEPVVDPTGPVEGSRRVLRGGSWFSGGVILRSALRDHLQPDFRYDFDGFRLCQPVPGNAVRHPPD